MSAIPVWRKAKMDHECSSWPTEAPTRFHSTHWTQSKDTKVDTKSQKCWEKRRSFSSFTAQPAPSTQRPHSRSSSITWQTFTSLAVTWPCDILCVCVCAWQVDGLDSSEEKDGSANQGLQALHGETWHQKFLFKHLTHVQQKLHIEVQVFTIFVNSHGHC